MMWLFRNFNQFFSTATLSWLDWQDGIQPLSILIYCNSSCFCHLFISQWVHMPSSVVPTNLFYSYSVIISRPKRHGHLKVSCICIGFCVQPPAKNGMRQLQLNFLVDQESHFPSRFHDNFDLTCISILHLWKIDVFLLVLKFWTEYWY